MDYGKCLPMLRVVWLLVGLGGCANTSELYVVRPATADLTFPAQVSLGGSWTGNAAYYRKLQALLEKSLEAAPSKLLTIDAQAPLRLSGSVEQQPPDTAKVELQTTCTDYAKEQPKRYPCVLVRRTTTVHVRIAVTLSDRAGRQVYQLLLPLSATRSTSLSLPQEDVRSKNDAPSIDLDQLYADLLADAAARLTKALAPHIETIEKPKLDCGAQADACNDAWTKLSACDYGVAKREFNEALAKMPPGHKQQDRAAALWGLAVSQELAGAFEQARSSLKAAQELDSTQSVFGDELSKLDLEQAAVARIRTQGATQLKACAH